MSSPQPSRPHAQLQTLGLRLEQMLGELATDVLVAQAERAQLQAGGQPVPQQIDRLADVDPLALMHQSELLHEHNQNQMHPNG